MVTFPHGGAAQVFRDFVNNGVPSSGEWRPRKDEIRALLGLIQSMLNAGGIGALASSFTALTDFHNGPRPNGLYRYHGSGENVTAHAPSEAGGVALFLGRSDEDVGGWLAVATDGGAVARQPRLYAKTTSATPGDWGAWFRFSSLEADETVSGQKSFSNRIIAAANIALGGGGGAAAGTLDSDTYIDINPKGAGVRIGRKTNSTSWLTLLEPGTEDPNIELMGSVATVLLNRGLKHPHPVFGVRSSGADGTASVRLGRGDPVSAVNNVWSLSYRGMEVGDELHFRWADGLVYKFTKSAEAMSHVACVLTRGFADARYTIATSSARYKDNITDAWPTDLSGLKVHEWVWGGELAENDRRYGDRGVGFIAEELYEVAPDCVYLDDDGAPEGIELTALVARIYQHFEKKIEALETRLAQLEGKG